MKPGKPKNLPASVRDRLLALARKQGEDFQLVLTRYAIERLLYRMSLSAHQNEFVLKGAMLFQLWASEPHRPTRDLDLLGKGDSSLTRLEQVFKEICSQTVEDDGLVFSPAAVHAERIKEDQDYEGVRVVCEAKLGQARVSLQVDIGFGDAITPKAEEVHYPTMLEFPAPVLRAYPRPTVVAEKFQAMVALGIANSRMKDFFDLWILARDFEFDGAVLGKAIQATFKRRKTALPAQAPLALTPEFGMDAAKVKQWQAFVRKGKLETGGNTLDQVCAFLNGFLMPPMHALGAAVSFDCRWLPSGPWSSK